MMYATLKNCLLKWDCKYEISFYVRHAVSKVKQLREDTRLCSASLLILKLTGPTNYFVTRIQSIFTFSYL